MPFSMMYFFCLVIEVFNARIVLNEPVEINSLVKHGIIWINDYAANWFSTKRVAVFYGYGIALSLWMDLISISIVFYWGSRVMNIKMSRPWSASRLNCTALLSYKSYDCWARYIRSPKKSNLNRCRNFSISISAI